MAARSGAVTTTGADGIVSCLASVGVVPVVTLHDPGGDHRHRIVAHRQCPSTDGGEHDRDSGHNRVAEYAQDKMPAKRWQHAGVVAAAYRQPVERDAEQQDEEQCEPEVGEARQDDEDRRQGTVEPAAAEPRAHQPDKRAKQEGDDGGHADQPEGPRQGLEDLLAHPIGEKRVRDA